MPLSTSEVLTARAALLARIRSFFAGRGVLEVETPLLGNGGTTDPHLESLRVTSDAGERYLQTSPEFAMKRLLARGAGPIYQVCKAFRAGERGRRHSEEFTLLEWYRPGFTLEHLATEVCELIGACVGQTRFDRATYRALFQDATGLDPHRASVTQLAARANAEPALAQVSVADGSARLARVQLLDLLFSHLVEPSLRHPLVVFDYPADQAALARIEKDAEGALVARRFEVYLRGMELANGYLELLDADELAARMNQDNEERRQLARAPVRRDEELLVAMRAGLPECSGVALGLDRLLMVVTGADSIADVISCGKE